MELSRKAHISIVLLAASLFLGGCIFVPMPYKGYPHKSVIGQVLDAETQEPIAGAKITMGLLGKKDVKPFGEVVSTTSDSSGFFAVRAQRTQVRLIYILFPLLPFDPASRFMRFGLFVETPHYETAEVHWRGMAHSGWAGLNPIVFEKEIYLEPIQLSKGHPIRHTVYTTKISNRREFWNQPEELVRNEKASRESTLRAIKKEMFPETQPAAEQP